MSRVSVLMNGIGSRSTSDRLNYECNNILYQWDESPTVIADESMDVRMSRIRSCLYDGVSFPRHT